MDQERINQTVSQTIERQRAALAEAITARHYELQPDLNERYGPAGRVKCLQDANYHLSYLCESIDASSPRLFADYAAWAKTMLEGRGIPAKDLAKNLEVMRYSLEQLFPSEITRITNEYIDAGLKEVVESVKSPQSFMNDTNPLLDLANRYLDALLRGERHVASRLILEAVESDTSVKDIYLYVFERSQYEIGRLWQMNRLSVAQEHYCTAATQLIMSQLYTHIFTTQKNGRTIVATCISGDLHEIGVRMVSDFFEMEGWDTFYLGANTPASSILQTIFERCADIVLISATMTFHVRAVKELIAAIRSSEICKGVKIMVGGYPFNVDPNLWKQIGADAYSRNALEAVAVANRITTKSG